MNASRLTTTLLAATLAGGSAYAQFDRELDSTVEDRTFFNYSTAGIDTLVQQGYRLSDIEVSGTSPMRFTGSAVKQTGEYASNGWSWTYGRTYLELLQLCNQNSSRLIDVERYEINGTTYYAGIMVDNTGPDAVQWYLWPNVTYPQVATLLQNTQVRFIDIEHFTVNGNEDRLTLLAISNTGQHARNWWYYIDYSLGYIVNKQDENNARLTEVDRIGLGRYLGIMVQDDKGPQRIIASATAASILARRDSLKMRVMDIESFLIGGVPRHMALFIDNLDQHEQFGQGCATNAGILTNTGSGDGMVGEQIQFTGTNFVPDTFGVFNLGFQEYDAALDPLGFIGCSIYTAPELVVPFAVDPTGTEVVEITIPLAPGLYGLEFQTQFFSLDRGNVTSPVATSNGVRTTVRG